MNFLSLFSGIGGFDLGLEMAGFKCVGQVEINPFCQKVLKKHWPHVKLIGDIRDVKGTDFGTVDVVCGGFPCQPFSVAGSRKGNEDDRYLWPEMLRVIQEIKPTWIVGENVAGIVSMALDKVLFDLESNGYEVQTFIIPACAVNAPHRRDRVWILGYSNSVRSCKSENGQSNFKGNDHNEERENKFCKFKRSSCEGENNVAYTKKLHDRKYPRGEKTGQKQQFGISVEQNIITDTSSTQCSQRQDCGRIKKQKQLFFGIDRSCNERFFANSNNERCEKLNSSEKSIEQGFDTWLSSNYWTNWPTQSGVCRGNDGLPNRVDRIKSLGNAVVPQIVYEIGKIILNIQEQIEEMSKHGN